MRSHLPIIVLAAHLALPASAFAAGGEASEDSAPVPSRLATGEAEDLLASLRTRLAINAQERDPFGLFQDPSKEPKAVLPARLAAKKKSEVPFATFINALSIGVAMPDDRMFMVGSRSFRVGQVMHLQAQGREVKARVESVQYDKIVFRNMASAEQELAVKSLDLLPNGVERSDGSITVKGVTPEGGGQELPVEIDLPLPPEEPQE